MKRQCAPPASQKMTLFPERAPVHTLPTGNSLPPLPYTSPSLYLKGLLENHSACLACFPIGNASCSLHPSSTLLTLCSILVCLAREKTCLQPLCSSVKKLEGTLRAHDSSSFCGPKKISSDLHTLQARVQPWSQFSLLLVYSHLLGLARHLILVTKQAPPSLLSSVLSVLMYYPLAQGKISRNEEVVQVWLSLMSKEKILLAGYLR